MFRTRKKHQSPTATTSQPLSTSRRSKLNRAKYGDTSNGGGGGSSKGHDKKDPRSSGLRHCCVMIMAFFIPIILLEVFSSSQDSSSVSGLWAKVQDLIQNTQQQQQKSLRIQQEEGVGGGLSNNKAATTKTDKPAVLEILTLDSPHHVSVKSDAAAIGAEKSITTTATKQQLQSTTANAANLADPVPEGPVTKIHIPRVQTIAYVVPFFISCGRPTTMRDAAATLRHSIHLQSAQTPQSGSQFGYQMYALLQKGKCDNQVIMVLEGLGYKVFQVDSPIQLDQIQNGYVRTNLAKGNTDGGIGSYIQLLAHELVEESIFTILYINTLVVQPLDDLYFAIKYPKGTPQGDEARSNLQSNLERPTDTLPNEIHHFFIRDYPNTAYDRKPVTHTPGFLVARKNPSLVQQAIDLIHQSTDYVEGYGVTAGWGGKGYSMYFVTGLTMPGFYAYFLDTFYANTSVELNGCKYNHNGMDNKFHKPPRYHPNAAPHFGKCRSGEDSCSDCTTTPPDSIYTILYDYTCFHPWKCYGEGEEGGTQRTKINTEQTTVEHCLILQKEWHTIRHKIELAMAKGTGSADVAKGQRGTYKSDLFSGHCEGHNQYLPMTLSKTMEQQLAVTLWGGK